MVFQWYFNGISMVFHISMFLDALAMLWRLIEWLRNVFEIVSIRALFQIASTLINIDQHYRQFQQFHQCQLNVKCLKSVNTLQHLTSWIHLNPANWDLDPWNLECTASASLKTIFHISMIFQGIEIFTNTWMLKSSPLLWGPVSASWFLSDLHFFAQRLAHFVSSNEQFCMHGQFHLLPLILAMVSAVSQGWKWYFNHGTSWYFSHFNVFSSYFNDI